MRLRSTLAKIDELSRAACEHGGRLEALQRAILAKAFRGELVPQDPSDEPADITLSRATAASEAPKPSNATRRKVQESRGARQEEA